MDDKKVVAKKTEAVTEFVQGVRVYHQGEDWFGEMTSSNDFYINRKDKVRTKTVTGRSPEEVIKKLGF